MLILFYAKQCLKNTLPLVKAIQVMSILILNEERCPIQSQCKALFCILNCNANSQRTAKSEELSGSLLSSPLLLQAVHNQSAHDRWVLTMERNLQLFKAVCSTMKQIFLSEDCSWYLIKHVHFIVESVRSTGM